GAAESGMAGLGRLAEEMVEAQRRWLRTRHTRVRLAESSGARAVPRGVNAVVGRMAETYRAITAQTGAATVVDSSKYPAEAAALCGRADVDVRVLHLVRDPRATAQSWRRAKAYIPAMGVLRSAGYWTAFNLASDRIGRRFGERYLRVAYEEFAARPREVTDRVMRWAGLPGPPPVDADGHAVLGANHTVTGNPDRLLSGPVRVRRDPGEPGRPGGLPWPHAAAATLLALPALRRHGYRWR
ncbi:MAG: sulfotransferase, partial [Micromonosporaceae bacterium]|nr:sulfotransferase [Micromonosporaceae bacterium]